MRHWKEKGYLVENKEEYAMNNRGFCAYRRTDVLTADPKRLVIMCYEGAIRELKIAKEKALKRQYDETAKAVKKCQAILAELLYGLDLEKGGQIAKNLQAIYNYMMRRILQGHVENDIGPVVDEVTGLLEELKETWEEIFSENKKDVGMSSANVHISDQFENPVLSTAYRPPVRL